MSAVATDELPAAPDSRWLLTLSTVLATMLYTVDSTIVNVALPHMQGSLESTQDQTAWIVTSYITVSAIMTPLAGWLGTRFGLRPILLASVAGFTLGSMLCGIATDLDQMVLFRILQGASGAALVPLSQVLLLQEFPRAQHGRVMALWGMGVLVGPIIGPTLGGWLTDELSWRWAFYINVPIGVISYLGLAASIRRVEGERQRRFDLTGFVLLSLALGLFQLMLDRGQTNDWFSSTEILAEAFFAALALYMFIVHSLTSERPFVEMRLFRDRNFTISLAMMFVIGVSIISPTVLLPNFLQQLQGYSPTQAGFLVASRGVSAVLAMMVAGRLIGFIDARLIMAVGVSIAAVSLVMMGRFTPQTPAALVAAAGFLQGFGAPFTFIPLSVMAFGTLPDAQRTEAGALLNLIRNIGASVGISTVVALLARSTQANHSQLSEYFTAFSVGRWQAIGASAGDNLATAALIARIDQQSAATAYSNDFYLLAAVTIAALPLLLLLRPSKTAARGPDSRAAAAHD